MSEHIVGVKTPSQTYDVHVGCGILDKTGLVVRKACSGTIAAVVADSNVAPLYADRVRTSLESAGYQTALVTFEAGERNKRLSTLECILEGLAQSELSRDDVVVALGGGVTGDMAGLAAAMYLRGIQVAQVPTSLLAMVDSSVGGKTAVDLAAGKNLAGAFLQPRTVIADIECLRTLDDDLYADACGEIIKHGVLASESLLETLLSNPLTLSRHDEQGLARIVAQNVAIKRDVVNADEKERGLRQTLNLGHTLGHAIEAASNYELGHGSCVATGLCCVARASERLGWSQKGTEKRIERVCMAHGLPTDTTLSTNTIMQYATHDKKRHGQTVNLVVPERIGHAELRTITLDELREVVCLGCNVSERA